MANLIRMKWGPHECRDWVRDFWKEGGYTTLDPAIGNVEQEQLVKNVDYSIKLDRDWLQHLPEHKDHAVIIGGGPSLKHALPEIRARADAGQHIFALNNSWKWLEKNGIRENFHVMLDARAANADFVPKEHTWCIKYYASQCAKEVWDVAPDAVLWNHVNAQRIVDHDARANTFLAGGSTVGLNAMSLSYILGYRTIHLYGFDSSYDFEDNHHAYDQKLNDKERIINVMVYDQEFTTAAWMAQQVNEFGVLMPILIDLGCTVVVHGDGLLPHFARNIQLPNSVGKGTIPA